MPAGTPAALFQTERWDQIAGSEMQWNFPVAPGSYEVRLYFAETYANAQKVGGRVFDVLIEGQTVRYELRVAHGDSDRLFGFAGELVRASVDLIAVVGAVTARA